MRSNQYSRQSDNECPDAEPNGEIRVGRLAIPDKPAEPESSYGEDIKGQLSQEGANQGRCNKRGEQREQMFSVSGIAGTPGHFVGLTPELGGRAAGCMSGIRPHPRSL